MQRGRRREGVSTQQPSQSMSSMLAPSTAIRGGGGLAAVLDDDDDDVVPIPTTAHDGRSAPPPSAQKQQQPRRAGRKPLTAGKRGREDISNNNDAFMSAAASSTTSAGHRDTIPSSTASSTSSTAKHAAATTKMATPPTPTPTPPTILSLLRAWLDLRQLLPSPAAAAAAATTDNGQHSRKNETGGGNDHAGAVPLAQAYRFMTMLEALGGDVDEAESESERSGGGGGAAGYNSLPLNAQFSRQFDRYSALQAAQLFGLVMGGARAVRVGAEDRPSDNADASSWDDVLDASSSGGACGPEDVLAIATCAVSTAAEIHLAQLNTGNSEEAGTHDKKEVTPTPKTISVEEQSLLEACSAAFHAAVPFFFCLTSTTTTGASGAAYSSSSASSASTPSRPSFLCFANVLKAAKQLTAVDALFRQCSSTSACSSATGGGGCCFPGVDGAQVSIVSTSSGGGGSTTAVALGGTSVSVRALLAWDEGIRSSPNVLLALAKALRGGGGGGKAAASPPSTLVISPFASLLSVQSQSIMIQATRRPAQPLPSVRTVWEAAWLVAARSETRVNALRQHWALTQREAAAAAMKAPALAAQRIMTTQGGTSSSDGHRVQQPSHFTNSAASSTSTSTFHSVDGPFVLEAVAAATGEFALQEIMGLQHSSGNSDKVHLHEQEGCQEKRNDSKRWSLPVQAVRIGRREQDEVKGLVQQQQEHSQQPQHMQSGEPVQGGAPALTSATTPADGSTSSSSSSFSQEGHARFLQMLQVRQHDYYPCVAADIEEKIATSTTTAESTTTNNNRSTSVRIVADAAFSTVDGALHATATSVRFQRDMVKQSQQSTAPTTSSQVANSGGALYLLSLDEAIEEQLSSFAASASANSNPAGAGTDHHPLAYIVSSGRRRLLSKLLAACEEEEGLPRFLRYLQQQQWQEHRQAEHARRTAEADQFERTFSKLLLVADPSNRAMRSGNVGEGEASLNDDVGDNTNAHAVDADRWEDRTVSNQQNGCTSTINSTAVVKTEADGFSTNDAAVNGDSIIINRRRNVRSVVHRATALQIVVPCVAGLLPSWRDLPCDRFPLLDRLQRIETQYWACAFYCDNTQPPRNFLLNKDANTSASSQTAIRLPSMKQAVVSTTASSGSCFVTETFGRTTIEAADAAATGRQPPSARVVGGDDSVEGASSQYRLPVRFETSLQQEIEECAASYGFRRRYPQLHQQTVRGKQRSSLFDVQTMRRRRQGAIWPILFTILDKTTGPHTQRGSAAGLVAARLLMPAPSQGNGYGHGRTSLLEALIHFASAHILFGAGTGAAQGGGDTRTSSSSPNKAAGGDDAPHQLLQLLLCRLREGLRHFTGEGEVEGEGRQGASASTPCPSLPAEAEIIIDDVTVALFEDYCRSTTTAAASATPSTAAVNDSLSNHQNDSQRAFLHSLLHQTTPLIAPIATAAAAPTTGAAFLAATSATTTEDPSGKISSKGSKNNSFIVYFHSFPSSSPSSTVSDESKTRERDATSPDVLVDFYIAGVISPE